MAQLMLPDGSVQITDETGQRPPIVIPPQLAGTFGPSPVAPLPAALPVQEAPRSNWEGPASGRPDLAAALGIPAENIPAALNPFAQAIGEGGSGGAAAVNTGESQGAGVTPAPPVEPEGLNYSPGPGDPNASMPDASGNAAVGLVGGPGTAGGAPAAAGAPAGSSNVTPDQGLAMGGAVAVGEASRGRPGGYTPPSPARDVVKTFQAQRGQEPLPPELQEQIKNVYGEGFANSLQTGDAVTRAQLESAKGHAIAADSLRRDIADVRDRQRQEQAVVEDRINAVNAHIARLQRESTRDIVKEYWASDAAPSRLQIAMGAFGAALLGSTTNPILAQANQEVNTAIAAQKMRLDAGSATTADSLGALAQMRATFTSPDAAEASAKALLFASLEQQALALAGGTASAETQGKYLELANQYSKAYTDYLVQAHQAESDKIAVSGVHVPASRGGYTAPREVSPSEMIGRLKKMGFKDDAAIAHTGAYFKALAEARAQGLPPEKAKLYALGQLEDVSTTFLGQDKKLDRAAVEAESRRIHSQVVMPDGEILYVNPNAAVKTQEKISALQRMNDGLAIIDKYLKTGDARLFKDLPTREQATVRTMLEKFGYDVKTITGEAWTEGDREATAYLRGQIVNNKWALGPEIEGNIETLRSEFQRHSENLKRTMFVDPDQRVPYAKGQQAPEGAKKEF